MSRQDLVKLLMRRDHISKEDANDLIDNCREDLESGNYEAIQEWLALEDDYIFDVLDY